MKLYLIRHTALQLASGICYGQSDVDVAISFRDELNQLKAKLADTHFEAVYSSPLQRCAKLAEALDFGEPVFDKHLIELNFGDWEMQAWDDIPRAVFDVWAHDYANVAPPNGETFGQIQQRGLSFLTHAMQTHPNQNIAVVTHGGVIRALLAHVLNMPLKGLFRFAIDYGSVTQLKFSEGYSKVGFVNR